MRAEWAGSPLRVASDPGGLCLSERQRPGPACRSPRGTGDRCLPGCDCPPQRGPRPGPSRPGRVRIEMWLAMHEDLRTSRRIRLLFDHLSGALSETSVLLRLRRRTSGAANALINAPCRIAQGGDGAPRSIASWLLPQVRTRRLPPRSNKAALNAQLLSFDMHMARSMSVGWTTTWDSAEMRSLTLPKEARLHESIFTFRPAFDVHLPSDCCGPTLPP